VIFDNAVPIPVKPSGLPLLAGVQVCLVKDRASFESLSVSTHPHKDRLRSCVDGQEYVGDEVASVAGGDRHIPEQLDPSQRPAQVITRFGGTAKAESEPIEHCPYAGISFKGLDIAVEGDRRSVCSDNVVDSRVDHHAITKIGISPKALDEAAAIDRRWNRCVRGIQDVAGTAAKTRKCQVIGGIRGADVQAPDRKCHRFAGTVDEPTLLICDPLLRRSPIVQAYKWPITEVATQ
jgi:hypothetical protein